MWSVMKLLNVDLFEIVEKFCTGRLLTPADIFSGLANNNKLN